MEDIIVVFITVPDEETGMRIASALLDDRLAACVNILPKIRSVYRWEKKIEIADEQLLVIKTRAAAFSKLESAIAKLHPYSTPEILSLPVQQVSERYRAWVLEETA